MTQEELWETKWQQVMQFVQTNRRRPSKYRPEEKLMHHWMHHNRRMLNQGEMRAERVAPFRQLLALCEQYRRKNQYD